MDIFEHAMIGVSIGDLWRKRNVKSSKVGLKNPPYSYNYIRTHTVDSDEYEYFFNFGSLRCWLDLYKAGQLEADIASIFHRLFPSVCTRNLDVVDMDVIETDFHNFDWVPIPGSGEVRVLSHNQV